MGKKVATDITLSDEQQAVVDASKELKKGETIKINACAGSGKTSTLVAIANANPDKKFLYMAFNKSVADEAKRKFGENVECSTSHSLAYRYMFNGMGFGDRPKLMNLQVFMIKDYFPKMDFGMCLSLLNEFKFFLNNARKEFPNENIEKLYNLILSHKVPMSHDFYLKDFQMRTPKERGLEDKYDCILFDEAQDANPVTADIIRKFGGEKIYVGDSAQSIYGFRGAINALDKIKADQCFNLTHSFRSTQDILDTANFQMNFYSKKLNRKYIPMISAVKDRPDIPDDKKKTAFITRTNSALIEMVAELESMKKNVYSVKPAEEIFKYAVATYLFSTGSRNFKGEFKFLNTLSSIDDLKDYAEKAFENEWLSAINIVKKYGADIFHLRDVCAQMSKKTSDYVITNAHTSKGLEWDNVMLCPDFTPLTDTYAAVLNAMGDKSDTRGKELKLEPFIQELNLYYVATTRAKRSLVDKTDNIMDEQECEYRIKEAARRLASRKKYG